MRINYAVNRTFRNDHQRRRAEHKNGHLEVPDDWDWDGSEIHTFVHEEVRKLHPGWTLTGYCPAVPLPEPTHDGELKPLEQWAAEIRNGPDPREPSPRSVKVPTHPNDPSCPTFSWKEVPVIQDPQERCCVCGEPEPCSHDFDEERRQLEDIGRRMGSEFTRLLQQTKEAIVKIEDTQRRIRTQRLARIVERKGEGLTADEAKLVRELIRADYGTYSETSMTELHRIYCARVPD